MAHLPMLVPMTLTLIQGHSGLTEEQFSVELSQLSKQKFFSVENERISLPFCFQSPYEFEKLKIESSQVVGLSVCLCLSVCPLSAISQKPVR